MAHSYRLGLCTRFESGLGRIFVIAVVHTQYSKLFKEMECAVHYKEPLKSFEIREAHSPDFGLTSEHQFIEVLKEKLIDFSDQKWIETIQSSRRYDIYRSFKPFRHKEIYISVVNIKSHRKLLARFRMEVSNIFTNKCKFLIDESFVCPLCIEEEEDETTFFITMPCISRPQIKILAPI